MQQPCSDKWLQALVAHGEEAEIAIDGRASTSVGCLSLEHSGQVSNTLAVAPVAMQTIASTLLFCKNRSERHAYDRTRCIMKV
jgi:hypothetical protein